MRKAADEGLTMIDATRVAAHLERTGCPNFASFVRQLDASATQANRRHTVLMADYLGLRQRLDQYEPRTVEKPFDPTPPAEASD